MKGKARKTTTRTTNHCMCLRVLARCCVHARLLPPPLMCVYLRCNLDAPECVCVELSVFTLCLRIVFLRIDTHVDVKAFMCLCRKPFYFFFLVQPFAGTRLKQLNDKPLKLWLRLCPNQSKTFHNVFQSCPLKVLPQKFKE